MKRDYVALEAQRRDLGLAGEEAVVRWEIEQLERAGHHRLARNVRHVSVLEGDGLGYDILSFDPGGDEKFIEVKTTRQGVEWPFLVSRTKCCSALRKQTGSISTGSSTSGRPRVQKSNAIWDSSTAWFLGAQLFPPSRGLPGLPR